MKVYKHTSPEQIMLWEKLQAYNLDDPHSDLLFSQRLANENVWPNEFGKRVIEEYKKFVFLAMHAGHPVTPSDEVDQVWHLHMIYTYEYWTNFCQNVLGRRLHHGPTKGGKQENEKYDDWYTKTKESYKRFFLEEPPEDIWPTSSIRFGRQYVRVNTQEYLIIRAEEYPIITRITVLLLNVSNTFKKLFKRQNK